MAKTNGNRLVLVSCAFLIGFIAGCGDNPTAPISQSDLSTIAALGFRVDMVVDRGEYYLVEGDIQINKAYLRELRAARGRSDDRQQGGPSFQYYTNNLVTNSGAIQTIKVDLSGLASHAGWQNAAVTALNDWSTVQNSYVKMVQGTPANITFKLIHADTTLAAHAKFPTGGVPGDTVYVNADFHPGFTPTAAIYRRNAVHELGHTIGFRHTNWNQVDCPPFGPCNGNPGANGANHVPYTPTSGGDPASVMNGQTAAQAWNGFSTYDKFAIRYLYPIPTTAVSVDFPNGTPTISWQPVVGATSYRVSLYNYSFWNSPEGASTTYGYAGTIGTTSGTSLPDPSRSYTGWWHCYFYYPSVPEDERRDYYYSVDAFLPNGSSLSLGVALVANDPAADYCS